MPLEYDSGHLKRPGLAIQLSAASTATESRNAPEMVCNPSSTVPPPEAESGLEHAQRHTAANAVARCFIIVITSIADYHIKNYAASDSIQVIIFIPFRNGI